MPREAVRVILEVVEGPHKGRKFEFDQHDNFIVGRAKCAHFRLPKKDPYFSRVHFMIEVNPPNCLLVDMRSTNGTFVNNRLVSAAPIMDGDLIRGGDTVLQVKIGGQLQTEAPVKTSVPHQPSIQSAESTATYRERPSLGTHTLSVSQEEPEHAEPEIDGYEMIRQLGQGGMGAVHLARRTRDGSSVAIKTISPAAKTSKRAIKHFLREAEILRQLQHPHIVAFHEVGSADEVLYLVMDYVPGTDAAELSRRDGPLPVSLAARLICQALDALAYAHRRGFVHRDVKPANLLVGGGPGQEVCKLADFGLARVYTASTLSGLTLLGDVGGTVPYMAPEQVTNYRDASPPADQYSTAATLYRLLTGHYLHDFDQTPGELRLLKVLFDAPVRIEGRRPGIPTALANVIHRALEKEPGKRFADAESFRDAIVATGVE